MNDPAAHRVACVRWYLETEYRWNRLVDLHPPRRRRREWRRWCGLGQLYRMLLGQRWLFGLVMPRGAG